MHTSVLTEVVELTELAKVDICGYARSSRLNSTYFLFNPAAATGEWSQKMDSSSEHEHGSQHWAHTTTFWLACVFGSMK